MANLDTPAKTRQIDGLKSSAPVSLGEFGLPIVLVCAAVVLGTAVYVFSAVESPAIWQETGIIP